MHVLRLAPRCCEHLSSTNINDPGGIGVWSYIHQPESYACMAESPAGFLADDDYHVSPRREINE